MAVWEDVLPENLINENIKVVIAEENREIVEKLRMQILLL